MSHYLLSLPQSPDDSKHALRYCAVSPLPRDIAAFCTRFGVKISSGYSQTEISGPIVIPGWVTAGDPTSCGRLRQGWPFYEVRIVDELDQEVPVGQPGELSVRTGAPWTLNSGYFGQPEATLSALRNGWFHTGDALRCDAEGNYFFIDRMKDAIRKSGENISSFEVEAIANSHPAVMESAAVAVPAETTEDEIKLFVVRKIGEDVTPADLVTFMATRMPRFMVPRFLEFIDELPRTPTLRVKKNELRARLDGDVWDRISANLKL
jgi:crotonobetaine/carnitine-CoA ligase